MTFLPLNLGVRHPSGAEKGPASKTDAEKTLKRDDFTCRFCGFRAQQFQRVIPFEGDYVTACTFCEQCLALERAGMMGSGQLIWLPEMAQAELNHLARAIYVARAAGEDIGLLATRALDALLARRSDAKKRLGGDDPLLLATVMHEMLSPEDLAQTATKLDGVRLLPLDKYPVRSKKGDINQFPHMVKYWMSSEGPYATFPAEKWVGMFQTAAGAAGHA